MTATAHNNVSLAGVDLVFVGIVDSLVQLGAFVGIEAIKHSHISL